MKTYENIIFDNWINAIDLQFDEIGNLEFGSIIKYYDKWQIMLNEGSKFDDGAANLIYKITSNKIDLFGGYGTIKNIKQINVRYIKLEDLYKLDSKSTIKLIKQINTPNNWDILPELRDKVVKNWCEKIPELEIHIEIDKYNI